LIEGLFRRIGAPVVCDLIVGRFRLIAADRYWLSDPFMSWFRWNFQQAQPTGSSATQSGMFPYILEKRRNWRVGRDSRSAVDPENAMRGG